MPGLIAFWSHALAAAAFAGLLIWRLGAPPRQPGQRLLLACFAVTGCWAWLAAIAPGELLVSFAETARNLVWIGLLHGLSARGDDRQHGVRLVYGAVAAVLALQLMADSLLLAAGEASLAETSTLLRLTAAAGALVLVHNVYGQASPASRSNIRLAMLALALIWTYDLNLYTIAYLDPATASGLVEWRGVVVALSAPLFALGAGREQGWQIRLSRAATFQSLSLLAICGYFAVMAILATALRGSGWAWTQALLVAALSFMTVGAMVLLPSRRARSWAKIKLAKHLFEHRYDYRTEWLRFTETLGSAGPDSAPLGERVIKAFADILDAPGGLLLVESNGALSTSASWNWTGRSPSFAELDEAADFWRSLEAAGAILELDAARSGLPAAGGKRVQVPGWMIDDAGNWITVPLIHHQRLAGMVLLAAPEYRRPLDWEDFDLLRTAGRQAASSLAEAHGQEALSTAQRFEEFNRRFAFIVHDIKNLVSQLSLLSRNAERHADNAEFRADMIATLRSSVGKMNDLLARLSSHSAPRAQGVEAQSLRPAVSAAIAAKRRNHEVRLLGNASLCALVDAPGLEQALGQLIQNAIDASPAGEPVTVRVSSAGEEVCIAISDKGAGMDGEFVRNRLFEPFASTKPGGFGIGAYEARSLISAMGGRLTVDTAPGRGTEFSIYLAAAGAAGEEQRKIA